MNDLTVTKLYIDSRFTSGDSKSPNDFIIDLPDVLHVPENTGFFVDDVAIPVSWRVVQANKMTK
jgi:hypothetical protein